MEENRKLSNEELEQVAGGSGMTATTFEIGDMVREYSTYCGGQYCWGTITGKIPHAYDSKFHYVIQFVRLGSVQGSFVYVNDYNAVTEILCDDIGKTYTKVSVIPNVGTYPSSDPYFA